MVCCSTDLTGLYRDWPPVRKYAIRICGVGSTRGSGASYMARSNGDIFRIQIDRESIIRLQVAHIRCHNIGDSCVRGYCEVGRESDICNPSVNRACAANSCCLTCLDITVVVVINAEKDVGKIPLDNPCDRRKREEHLFNSNCAVCGVGQLKGE